VHNPYLFELSRLHQREMEHEAEHQRLVWLAIKVRHRNRKAAQPAPEPIGIESAPVERPQAVSIGR
jgi:hypothetical protein